MERQITNDVISLFHTMPTDVGRIIETSRTSVCSWLPILDVPELAWKVCQLQEEPSVDVATLLLAVHLMNELSTPAIRQFDRDIAPLLAVCRRLFLALSFQRKETLETVQAGIILSALQLDAGQLIDASLTITLCANIGRQLSLDHVHLTEISQYSRLDIKKRNIWYAIALLDRYILDTEIDIIAVTNTTLD